MEKCEIMKIFERLLLSFSIFLVVFFTSCQDAYAQANDANPFTVVYLLFTLLSCLLPIVIGGVCTAWIYADGKKRVLYRKNYWHICLILGIIGIFLSPIFSIIGVVIWYLMREQAQQPEFIMGYPPYYPPYADPYMQYAYPQNMQYPYPPPPPPDYKEDDKNVPSQVKEQPSQINIQGAGPKEACKKCYRPYDPKNETCITCTKV